MQEGHPEQPPDQGRASKRLGPSRWTIRRKAKKNKLTSLMCTDPKCSYHLAHLSLPAHNIQLCHNQDQYGQESANSDVDESSDEEDGKLEGPDCTTDMDSTTSQPTLRDTTAQDGEERSETETLGRRQAQHTISNISVNVSTQVDSSSISHCAPLTSYDAQTLEDSLMAQPLDNLLEQSHGNGQPANNNPEVLTISDSSDESGDESCGKIIMHFLAEDYNQPNPDPPPDPEENEDPENGGADADEDANPDNPDPEPDGDPDPGNDDDEEEEEDSDDEGETFSFEDIRMNTPLQFGHAGCTVRESILLNLGLAVKYHWTYEALADSMASWSTALGRRGFIPETKKQLWSMIKKSGAGISKYAYCPECLEGFGLLDELEGEIIVCEEEDCGAETPRQKVPWFVSLSLRKQFKQFLSIPGISGLLRYREERRKHREDAMEDIFDGEVYTTLVQNGTITENDFTYILNTDGFSLFKHRSLSVWGLLLRLNELPPNMRQKYMFLAGIWVGKKEPKMNTFMAPFVEQATTLARRGLNWRRDGVNIITSKFIGIGLTVDAVARALCMNQVQYNGNYGCYICTHLGIYLAGCVKFPILPYEDLPEAIERTHDTIVAAMRRNVFHEGQKGPCELMNLPHFSLAEGNCMDDLHPFYEGITAAFLELLIPQLRNQPRALGTANFRMRDVRTPVQMARKWLSIHKRRSWKGTQWSYFIRYQAVLCFKDNYMSNRNLEHLSMLSYALFVFSQDSMDPEDFERASEYADRFAALYQEYYGAENMTFNMHMLTHVAQARRRWSSAWTTSTFNFESWNGQLGHHVTSAKGAADQIVARHLLKMYVHSSPYRNDISQRVKDHLSDLLFASQRKIAERINEDICVLGRGRERPATLEEQNFLRREGADSRVVTVYERVLVRGIEYRIRTYHEDTRSDSSYVFTWDNRFLNINKIIVVQVNEDKVCFVLANVYDVDYPVRFAHHIAHTLGDEETILRPAVFRVPVTKMVVQEQTYLVPMANCFEID